MTNISEHYSRYKSLLQYLEPVKDLELCCLINYLCFLQKAAKTFEAGLKLLVLNFLTRYSFQTRFN